MLKDRINEILPVVMSTVISILGIIITTLGAYTVNFIKLKRDSVINEISINKYNQDKKLALDIWNIVEEHFRVNEIVTNALNSKIKMFNYEIKKKCPYLTQQEIDFLRQAVAGQINSIKNEIND
ncbi:hypothetical protein CPAST_c23490 [Clostridium pasteurianum DSM 525 = ATCC 6013]|uniref:Uncharacterized protein n=1 Tax=Clostridium pasteurianum DSM 525 = ATCC 6013 TaxID=1262449 RepID=A0A0H3J4K9_CLOPA|nr:hypothetical protein [Clostridium pasteurianum]AJA48419.1 hypothetical protein CPAST_c23490 [Clostridium pasteurianum DSM 525 = ATCC 6013]AJA52407.1 hypothetical protein CLPA_c23490 [Clostridium pasteurianum DSM 525 = ATCC 6013]AOZ75664.1 hypothetical protein AQ983_11420 [Clostridium pasteurianum DSM 525 = ATCC 6013]AOZ79460.1 hypothetical protein AQ984_11415 [Clostridium pasteurianum]ELP60431.1 hypothetical protein F502_03062 [Clostridium pasteurianum DSM 525 = ATCC 6013]